MTNVLYPAFPFPPFSQEDWIGEGEGVVEDLGHSRIDRKLTKSSTRRGWAEATFSSQLNACDLRDLWVGGCLDCLETNKLLRTMKILRCSLLSA